MKLFKYLVCAALFFYGCAHKGQNHTGSIKAPSTGAVKENISNAQEHSNNLKSNLDKSTDYSKRIDNKAEVLLEHWH